MQNPKFEIGTKVKFLEDRPTDAGEVVEFSFKDGRWLYKITSKELDFEKKEIINGFKTGYEDELEAVGDESNE